MEILREDQIDMLEMKMNPFNVLTSWLNTTKKLLNFIIGQ